jgi:hypothetical protein
MYNFLVLLVLILPTNAIAGEGWFGKYGVGLPADPQNSISDVKTIFIGRQYQFSQNSPFKLLDWKWEVGGWADNAGDGRKHGGFGSASIGLEPQLDIFYINAFWGVGAATHPDTMLGSHFQFVQDFGVGFKDARGVGVGFSYKHISNAGMTEINRGRDFITIQLRTPW